MYNYIPIFFPLNLQVNNNSDLETPEHFCAEIHYPNEVNTTTVCSSEFQPEDSINETLIVTFNISGVRFYNLNVTVRISAIRDNVSSSGNPISVYVGKLLYNYLYSMYRLDYTCTKCQLSPLPMVTQAVQVRYHLHSE